MTMMNIEVKKQVEEIDDKINENSPDGLEKRRMIYEQQKLRLTQFNKKHPLKCFGLEEDSDSSIEHDLRDGGSEDSRSVSGIKTEREYRLSVNQRKIDLEKQIIAKKVSIFL